MTRAERDRCKKALQDFFRESSVSSEAARKALVKTGIFTKRGKVTRNYGGPVAATKLTALAEVSKPGDKPALRGMQGV